MTTTARDIVEAAARKIHVMGRGQTLSADEAKSGFEALNDMLATWSIEGGYVVSDVDETFSLTNATSFTIGTGGDFDTEVPYDINTVFISAGGIDYYLRRIGQQEYAQIALKNTGAIPDVYYFNYGYPIATITLYPVATPLYTITINSYKRITEFTNLTSDINLPPEYRRALIYNLAVELAPDYEKEPSPTVMRLAAESKDAVFAANTRNDELVSEAAYAVPPLRDFNIYKGNLT